MPNSLRRNRDRRRLTANRGTIPEFATGNYVLVDRVVQAWRNAKFGRHLDRAVTGGYSRETTRVDGMAFRGPLFIEHPVHGGSSPVNTKVTILIPMSYRRILCTTDQCAADGLWQYRATSLTAFAMSGRVIIVDHIKWPTIWRYRLSPGFSSSVLVF